jgi:hypothetical protein
MPTTFERLLARGDESEDLEPELLPGNLPYDQMPVVHRIE